MKRSTFVWLVVILILIIDQVSKFWVKTSMTYGEEFGILGLHWARIHFVENEGMAFGIQLGGEAGKLALSVFRLVAVAFLIYIIRTLVKAREAFGLLLCFGLILAGAIGNIIDSAVYGIVFSDSTPVSTAQLFPPEGGYASFLHGHVVDMLHFPMIDTYLPSWVPIWGGDRFQFFRPVFNVADTAISTGVIAMLVFHRRFLRTGRTHTQADPTTATPEVVAGAVLEEE